MFAQILQIVPKAEFMRLVARTGAERHSKGFSCWAQFVAMLFCQMAQSKSLREITDGLTTVFGKLNHLGLREAPKRSTLAYANRHRPWQLYMAVFFAMLDVCRAESPGKKAKFRFKNKLMSLDASVIDLCLGLFPWADFRQTKGAVKLHLLLDHDGYLPVFAIITDGKTHELSVAHQFILPKGSIVVVDKGYCDFDLFHAWDEKGVYFVTRLKDNAAFEVVDERSIPEGRNIIADQIIRFTGPKSSRRYPGVLRRVVVWDERFERELVLLTNQFKFVPTTISEVYRDRWQIELFFKVLKQHLKVKTFVGTSPDALRTQIWIALIAVLLIKYLQFRSRCDLALCRLVALLRLHLFSYVELWSWLDDPFHLPPEQSIRQIQLAF
jgi:hypothetical protein